jgi:hypothetical protein
MDLYVTIKDGKGVVVSLPRTKHYMSAGWTCMSHGRWQGSGGQPATHQTQLSCGSPGGLLSQAAGTAAAGPRRNPGAPTQSPPETPSPARAQSTFCQRAVRKRFTAWETVHAGVLHQADFERLCSLSRLLLLPCHSPDHLCSDAHTVYNQSGKALH